MKRSIYTFCYIVLMNALPGIDKNELAKFKSDSKKFSESIDISKSKSGKKTKDDLVMSKKLLPSKENKDNSNFNKKDKATPKASLFEKLFGSKSEDKSKSIKKENQETKSKKIKDAYEDPFAGLDTNLFEVGKTKVKSDEKQKNTDKKKANKKAGEDKAENKKKEEGFFFFLGSKIKTGMSALAKSDLGKEMGGVLKDSAVSVASNAVSTGTQKLNQEVSSLNNKISGNEKKDLLPNIEKKANDVEIKENADSVSDYSKNTIIEEQNNDTDTFENFDIKNEYKKDENNIQSVSDKLNNNVVAGSNNSMGIASNKGFKSKKNKKRKANKSRKKK